MEHKPLILQALELQEFPALDIDPEWTPEQAAEVEARWEAEFETRLGDIRERFGAIGRVLAREQFLAEQFDPEINALKRELEVRTAARKRHEAHIDRLKKYAVKCLEVLGTDIEAEGKVYGLKKNPPSVEVADPANLRLDYISRIEYHADKKAIKEALQSGVTVPGCSLKQGHSLKVKGV